MSKPSAGELRAEALAKLDKIIEKLDALTDISTASQDSARARIEAIAAHFRDIKSLLSELAKHYAEIAAKLSGRRT
ncbi:MAG TPA: hypothetical protein VEA41_09090 [Salinarimonas sp.]|nr:hypothetical protein [Salinarimonas sp.]